jgi:hypothetical protein
MSQGDYLIQNQSFPSFRSDLNETLEAINTSNSGTSRPTSAVAGTIWLDTTNATTPTLKLYDGTDDISLATFDYSANTVNWLDSTVSADLVNDLSPQLGGMLDVNGNAIGNGTEELIKFSETVSAVNEVTVTNSATGNAPEISATGDDTNIDFKLTPKGTGKLILDGLNFPTADGTTGQFLKTDGSGNLSFDDVGGGGLVLQVVSARTGTQVTSNSATYTDTGLTASITPSSTSNKILVMVQQSFAKYSGDTYGNFRVYRDSTEIGGTIPFREVGNTESAIKNVVGTGFSCSILDTPSSTSSLTYKTQYNNGPGIGTASVQYGSGNSYITLMEIAG